jgi:pyruvyltransferase
MLYIFTKNIFRYRGLSLAYTLLLLFISSLNLSLTSVLATPSEGLPLYYWQQKAFVNFGDYISLKLVERIVDGPVQLYKKKKTDQQKLLAIGSILYHANENDVLWGTGFNGKFLNKKDYNFSNLDVRALRGPLTRQFLSEHFGIQCPTIYGDPALMFPYFFPELTKSKNPTKEYIIIPHFSEKHLFPRDELGIVVYPTDPWDEVIKQILNSKFVISSSLHGVIIAEAYGIPARMLRVTHNEPLIKYQDYYFGTGRPNFLYATSVEEALKMGGEGPFKCDLEKLYDSFPFEFWPKTKFKKPKFKRNG